ncbi:MAG: Na+/H+ antiporter NhaC family protein [Tissierellia bacterium]|nr:Na+/H+ antiporter NhaC family protein [Tissierellia bacterium]
MDFGILSILPALIAIIIALITKEVITSLLFGILSGGLIFCHGHILAALELVFSLMGVKVGDNALMIIFLGLLGSLVMVMNRAGGSFAYGKWAGSKIKRKSSAKLATGILGSLIFIDDYFNCLTVGAVMQPITDGKGISRAKLAHIIDSTAAPICILAPISSWAASVVAIIGDTGVANPMQQFLKTIPLNAYALLTLFMVFYFAFSKTEIGLMEDFEREDKSRLSHTKEEVYEHSDKGKVIDLILPIITLIGTTVFMMLRTGGYFEGVSAGAAFGDADVNLSLVVGSIVAIFIAFILFVPRKLMTFREFIDGTLEGIKSMTTAIAILILAWTIGGISGSEYLNAGGYIADIFTHHDIPMWLLPMMIFLISSLLSFATGTAWGTFGILVPILVPVLMHMNQMDYLHIVLASIFSGSVFGDHCSPISDTTILSSAGAGCDHLSHVRSQLPYAMLAGGAALFGFFVAGITGVDLLVFPVGVVVLLGLIFLAKRRTLKKYS